MPPFVSLASVRLRLLAEDDAIPVLPAVGRAEGFLALLSREPAERHLALESVLEAVLMLPVAVSLVAEIGRRAGAAAALGDAMVDLASAAATRIMVAEQQGAGFALSVLAIRRFGAYIRSRLGHRKYRARQR